MIELRLEGDELLGQHVDGLAQVLDDQLDAGDAFFEFNGLGNLTCRRARKMKGGLTSRLHATDGRRRVADLSLPQNAELANAAAA